MTIPEITAYVMGLPVEDVRRLSATDVMGWHDQAYPAPGDLQRLRDNQRMGIGGTYVYWESWENESGSHVMYQKDWRPDEDRNQSRMVTDKVLEIVGDEQYYCHGLQLVCGNQEWDSVWAITPDQETRAALIAHMIHKQEVGS